MKAFILAAGTGSRMGEHTKDTPKCLLPFQGKRLIDYALSAFLEVGINDVTVITGHCSEKLNLSDLTYVNNPSYNSTNMVYSLFRAAHSFDDDFIISYGDIIYETSVIKKLINDGGENLSVITDNNWLDYWNLRFDNPLDDAETLIISNNNEITEIGEKPNSLEDIHSQYIGLIKVGKNALSKFNQLYPRLQEDVNQDFSFRGRNANNLYMTDYLQMLVDEGTPLRAVPITGGWLEFDTSSDYKLYKKLFNESSLDNFFKLDRP